MRKRLSWDAEKAAEIMKQADPYTMNQERHNPPVEKYHTGDPSAWGEDQNMAKPWEHEGRTETGHPAPAREAVVQARKLEDKALKCITIAQRMLPGADETLVEDQATDFMFMPERAIMATLQRQAELASKIAAECEEEKEEKEEEAKEKDAAACKEEEMKEEEKAKEKDAAKEEEVMPEEKEEEKAKEKDAAKKEEKEPAEEEEVKPEEKEVSAKEEVEEKEEKEEKAEEKEASQDLLDILFDSVNDAPVEVPKTGAKKLSGLVQKSASNGDPLSGLWETPPDISSVFGRNR